MKSFYRLSLMILLVLTCGVGYLSMMQISEDDANAGSHNIFTIYQYGTNYLFALPAIKYNYEKDMLLLNSNQLIAPIANTLSGIIWAGLILLITNVFKQKTTVNEPKWHFWKRAFFLNLGMAASWFLLWTIMSAGTTTHGYYEEHTSLTTSVLNWLQFLFFMPSVLPSTIAYKCLEQGTDSWTGYQNLYIVSQTASAFSTPVWAIGIALVYTWLNKKRTAPAVLEEMETMALPTQDEHQTR